MLAAVTFGCGLLIPGAPKASSNVARPTFDRRAALAAAAAVVVAPVSVFAEDAPAKEEPAKEEAAADAPKKKKADKGPEPNLGGPPMSKQANALGFVTSEKMPQFRPTGATPSKPFKPPPLGKVRRLPTLAPSRAGCALVLTYRCVACGSSTPRRRAHSLTSECSPRLHLRMVTASLPLHSRCLPCRVV